jgi:hypothetical protein
MGEPLVLDRLFAEVVLVAQMDLQAELRSPSFGIIH